jgi:hypothetical protein
VTTTPGKRTKCQRNFETRRETRKNTALAAHPSRPPLGRHSRTLAKVGNVALKPQGSGLGRKEQSTTSVATENPQLRASIV